MAGNERGEISGNEQILLEHAPIVLYHVFRVSLTRRRARGIVNCKISLCPWPELGNAGGAVLSASQPSLTLEPFLPPPAALRQDLNCHHSFPSINHPIARMKCIFHDPTVLRCILLGGKITKHFLAFRDSVAMGGLPNFFSITSKLQIQKAQLGKIFSQNLSKGILNCL